MKQNSPVIFVHSLRRLARPVEEEARDFVSMPGAYLRRAFDPRDVHHFHWSRVRMRHFIKGGAVAAGSGISTIVCGFYETASVLLCVGIPAAAIYGGLRAYGRARSGFWRNFG